LEHLESVLKAKKSKKQKKDEEDSDKDSDDEEEENPWKKCSSWKPCAIGLLPNGVFPSMELPIELDHHKLARFLVVSKTKPKESKSNSEKKQKTPVQPEVKQKSNKNMHANISTTISKPTTKQQTKVNQIEKGKKVQVLLPVNPRNASKFVNNKFEQYKDMIK